MAHERTSRFFDSSGKALTTTTTSRGTGHVGGDLSVDSLDDHKRWLKDIEATQGVKLDFPVIADPNRTIADLAGMIQGNGNLMATGRMALVIDSDKVVRLSITYPESTGRNFNEILRAIDSLKLATSRSRDPDVSCAFLAR